MSRKVCPVRFDICVDCSYNESDRIFDETYTVQYLRYINTPSGRSCFGNRHMILQYVCGKCGGLNFG